MKKYIIPFKKTNCRKTYIFYFYAFYLQKQIILNYVFLITIQFLFEIFNIVNYF